MAPVKINIEEIPKIEVRLLCSAFLEDIKRFYESPANQLAFEAWMKERSATA